MKFKTDFWSTPFLALDDVSFTINTGEITGFLGANGAGKTTLLKILIGLIKQTEGQVVFEDSMGKSRKEILSKVGYMPERPYFYPHLTGREFVQYLASLNDLSWDKVEEGLKYWSEKLKLAFALDRKIRTYSKGMLQRLGLITSIIHDPAFIILDEPLSGLDPIGRKEIKDAIVEINGKGKTVFFSSHIVPDIEEICHSVVFLEKGRLLYHGGINKLVQDNLRPGHVLEASFEASPRLATPFKLLSEVREKGEASILRLEVDWENKNELLKEVLAKGGNVLSFNGNRIGLEEIFYKVKQYEQKK